MTGRVDVGVVAALATTLLLWAAAFVGIRAGLEAYAPAQLVLLRFLVASVTLAGWEMVKGGRRFIGVPHHMQPRSRGFRWGSRRSLASGGGETGFQTLNPAALLA